MKYNMDLPKVIKYSHNIMIVLNVFYWTSIITACLSFISSIVIIFLSDSVFRLSEGNLYQSGFSLDGVLKFSFNEVPQEANMKKLYFTIMLMAAFICVLISLILKQLVLITKTVEEEKPFEADNAKRIFTIGFVLLISSFLIPITEVIVAKAMVLALGLHNVSINYSINITFLVAGFVMFILSGIFSYGSYLQYEYDETI